MLTFKTTDDHLLVGGKTFYVKDVIKVIGGKWQSSTSSWAIPVFLDNNLLRDTLQKDSDTAYSLIKKKEREQRKAQKAYDASSEGMAAAADAERQRILWCFEQKQKTGAYWWLCCADCKVVDWNRRCTSCMKCAEWDGYCWNSFRKNGSIFTGD